MAHLDLSTAKVWIESWAHRFATQRTPTQLEAQMSSEAYVRASGSCLALTDDGARVSLLRVRIWLSTLISNKIRGVE